MSVAPSAPTVGAVVGAILTIRRAIEDWATDDVRAVQRELAYLRRIARRRLAQVRR